MTSFALLAAFRSVSRHRLHAVLNIGGLAVGIAVFLVLGLYVRFETGFERWLPGYKDLYVVETVWNLPGSAANGAYPTTMGGLLEELRDDFPGLVGTRIFGGEGSGSVLHDGVATVEDTALVDANFLDLFPLDMVRGDGAALRDPTAVLLSETVARRYFGAGDPLGRTLTVSFTKPTSYRVAGVFRDLPKTSDLRLGILGVLPARAPSRQPPFENWYHWGSTVSMQTFLRFPTPAAAAAFQARLPGFVNRRALKDQGPDAWATEQLALLPLDRLHLEPQGSGGAGRKLTVVTLGLVGLLTLGIAIVNYVNLATARAALRAREVAMRKVLGASRAALLGQFLGEAVLTVALAALAGLILAELGLPLVNAAGSLSLAIPYLLVVPALAGLALAVGVAAGLYPAVLLARVPAAAVLASARAPGGGRAGTRVREALVAVQFALAVAFMVATAVLVAQTWHVRHTDLGFRREGLLVVRSLSDDTIPATTRRAVAYAIRATPGVTAVAFGNGAVGGSPVDNSDNVVLPGVPGPGPNLRWVLTGPGFFRTYEARLLAGRWFDDAHGDDAQHVDGKRTQAVIINRQAIGALRFRSAQDAIGKTVGGGRPRTIVGVVDDLRFASPREPVGPALYYYYRRAEEAGATVAAVRFTGDPRTTLARVEAVWRRLVPQVPFAGGTADQRLAEFYAADEQATRLFGIGAGLAVLIGCVGLWGLASFTTARRIREIGIRKTLGASSGAVAGLLVGQFLRPVLLANLAAWPLAFVAMRTWLGGFDDRIALSPLFFVGATLAALLIAAATVLGQSLRASRATPAWALRHD